MSETELRGVDCLGARDAAMDPDALRRAFGLLESWIADRVVPGAAALVVRGGKVAGEAYLGTAQRANAGPVTSGTIFSLASVTKPFTATAVMLLVERGAIALNEPLAGLLPEFLETPATPFDRRGVTLRHLLAHCSGLPGFGPDNLALRQAHRPLEDFVRSFIHQPLFFDPGTLHMYSNVGILLAAEVVGRAVAGDLGAVSETPRVGHYHGFVHEEILAPLSMAASSLLPSTAWDERIAWVEETGQQGQDYEMDNSAYYRSLGIPWGGMFSRARDLARFVDLFLPTAGGRPRVGVDAATAVATPRLLSPAAAAAMIAEQFAPPHAPADVAPGLREDTPGDSPAPAVPWGIGWGLKGTTRAWPSGELSSAGTYGHGGSSGTMVWADPATDVVCVLLTNRAFASGWAGDRPRLTLFSNAVLAAVR